jgi:hypothetical protein
MRGIQLGGGRQHLIKNNTFLNCSTNVAFDNRGMYSQGSYCEPGGTFNDQLDSVSYQQPPWSVAYPWLPAIYDDEPCVPVWNNFTANRYYPCGNGFVNQQDSTIQSWDSNEWDNVCDVSLRGISL